MQQLISIHAPREGCDSADLDIAHEAGISIHAPREGCDRGRTLRAANDGDFNPRTPRGVRRKQGALITFARLFQSTHPARGATLIFPFQPQEGQ